MTGFVLYEGPSELDGAPIVCIATRPGHDKRFAGDWKTEGIWQTYILAREFDPVSAIKEGVDLSVCGDCIHRGVNGHRSCYVNVGTGAYSVWHAFHAGKYERGRPTWERLLGETIRVGTYGDPAAVPMTNWDFWLRDAATVGYTHQWRVPRFSLLRRWCMASCESEADVVAARALGWRAFRVRSAADPLLEREVVCPASAEAGHKANCAECRACGGLSAKANCDIAIIVHGDKGKVRAFERKKEAIHA